MARWKPFIGAETMQIHHDKHHRAYVDSRNNAVAGYAQFDNGEGQPNNCSQQHTTADNSTMTGSLHICPVMHSYRSPFSPHSANEENA
jgi:superoxide dismutase